MMIKERVSRIKEKEGLRAIQKMVLRQSEASYFPSSNTAPLHDSSKYRHRVVHDACRRHEQAVDSRKAFRPAVGAREAVMSNFTLERGSSTRRMAASHGPHLV